MDHVGETIHSQQFFTFEFLLFTFDFFDPFDPLFSCGGFIFFQE
jgi:hypothetical protein